MLQKLMRDFNANKHLAVNTDNTSSQLTAYYFKFEEDLSKLNRLIHSFDSDGVPINTSYIDVKTPLLHYYPITIGQYGLAVFHAWLQTGNPEKKALFLRIADWFMAHATEETHLGVYWLTEVPKPEFNVHSPWKSAFAQSRSISVLARAWQITGKEMYIQTAAKALIPFTLDTKDGGVSVDRAKGETFFEEYVAALPTRVLDGHGFSLFGLHDFMRASREEPSLKVAHELAYRLFNEGVEGLIQQLPRFDLKYWIRFNYCDLPNYPQDDPCTIGYLRLVLLQLKVLHEITGRAELQFYQEKFSRYDTLTNILKMYRTKLKTLRKLNRL